MTIKQQWRCLGAVMLTVMLFVLTSETDTDPFEVSALQDLYKSLNNPQQLRGWKLEGGDPCGEVWMGVSCSGSSISELQLRGLKLLESLGNHQLQHLLHILKNLDVSFNNLQGETPLFGLPPNATHINMAAYNNLPFSLPLMTSLLSLNLSLNSLSGPLGYVFSGLQIKEMDLSFNNLTGDLPSSFGSLLNPTSLYLQNNRFTGSIIYLSDLPLTDLNSEDNQFSGIIPSHFQSIPHLWILGNKFHVEPSYKPWKFPLDVIPMIQNATVYPTTQSSAIMNFPRPQKVIKKKKKGIVAGSTVLLVGGVALLGTFFALFAVGMNRRRAQNLAGSHGSNNSTAYTLPVSTGRDQPRLLWDIKDANKELTSKKNFEREKTLVYPTVGNTGPNKRQNTAGSGPNKKQKTAGSGPPQELPIINRDVIKDMDDRGRIPSTTSFINFHRGSPCLLWEVPGKVPEGDLATRNWRPRGGPVRDQSDHDNCWTYTSTDVYSSYRLENGEDQYFRLMSAKYLTFYVSEEERKRKRPKKDRRINHLCHGFPVLEGLKFIQEHGVPAEEDDTSPYSCVTDPPDQNQQLFSFDAEVKFLQSDRIEDLHKMLLHQAVSANMIMYNPEYDEILSLNKVYEGPTSAQSVFVGIHAVLVLAIVWFNGKWVALIKLSHGEKAGEGGYMYVSLTRMIMAVKYSATANKISQIKDDDDEPLADPSYLLREFTGVKYGGVN